ncbi:MAG: NADPH-dependent glutamate synthase [Ignavibacteriota bacterium]
MLEDVKYLKFKTYLNTYCPHCRNTFNYERKDEKYIVFKSIYKGEEAELKLSPYLDVFDVESSVEVAENDRLDDLICPKCKKSLIVEEPVCGECGSPVAELIITAFSKLMPFFICLKHGCTWHGLSKADENRVKLKIPRQDMPEQDMKLRVANHGEVPYGYTTELAQLEAGRCLQCKDPKCVKGCPVNVDIPAFISLIRDEKVDDAAKKIKETNMLPAVCGRVCPQESQCEALCILGLRDRPVAIGNLEKFVADYERKMDLVKVPVIKTKLKKKVAVVGSGPAGLTAAADLIQRGYSVTIYEALHEAGGVLVYGIPEFRLPKSIVNFEIDYLKQMGVKIELNCVIGNTITMDELLEHFDAVFIGVGAGLPVFMNIPGETLGNVFSANEYLTRMNLMKAYKFPEYDTPKPKGNKVVVLGGGNVAMDSARTAIRTGSTEVTVVYRRSRQELPARHEEVRHAEEEGVKFMLLTAPVKYIGNDQGILKGLECLRMQLGEPDSSGRRRPIPIEGSNFVINCDVAVVAIGNSSNPILFQTATDIKRNKWGNVEVNPETNQTSKEHVYAGGDIVTGAATVIQAMGAGRVAANAIHKKLSAG